ncbi:hypothetical protein DSM106972_008560 [Dulcicalothrix desertica PCC 7102]|uniref:DUF1822 domain-containing protein n=1 Tax=Dulcicalothrix desertica PCC 7102 TaxID=232991 RepID=A0A433VRQ4_9CYAN|nr:DUF1822 family protein [Dulcicalothrix desertica]RUT08803.1 hypothetical protein DSM106972_008560 [Dulcicalothrix desertica PCC 7102]TWH44180.1 uncharacterized protein DUF1822 [Dulcicalothrix desertica PCC 7102]
MSPKVIWIEPESVDEAQRLTDIKTTETNQWQTYLNKLARLEIEKWLRERIPDVKISHNNWDVAFDNISYLSASEFILCLITVDNLINDFVTVTKKIITSVEMNAHFYVLLEILEEEQQLNIHGFLRYDELFKYCQNKNVTSLPDGFYQLPLSLFDRELNNLLLYTRFLEPSAIFLKATSNSANALAPVKTKIDQVLINLSKWCYGIVEEAWQSTDLILNQVSGDSTWGYVRSQSRNNQISQAKLFDLGLLLQNKSLALIINLKDEENREKSVLVQVIPNPEKQQILPHGLKLKVILYPNTPESVSQEAVARESDQVIQLEFSETPGQQFQVEVSYQDAMITEYFVL